VVLIESFGVNQTLTVNQLGIWRPSQGDPMLVLDPSFPGGDPTMQGVVGKVLKKTGTASGESTVQLASSSVQIPFGSSHRHAAVVSLPHRPTRRRRRRAGGGRSDRA
jgi:hypothetical protein